MKKILSLLFLSSSLFSMELDIVRYNTKVAAVKSMHKDMHSESYREIDPIKFNSKKVIIEKGSVFVPNKLGELELSHGKKGFCVYKDDKKHVIQKYFTDPVVRNVTKEQLKRFLEVGYLSLNQMDNGEFLLKANGRINGGGPILGAAAYWITKSLCYGVGLAAVGTVAVGTAGAGVAVVTGGAAALGGAAVAGTVGTVTAVGAGTAGTIAATAGATTAIATTAGVVVGGAATAATVVTGAGVVAGAITTAGVAGEAALVTAGVVSSAGGIAATIAGVESVSVAVGTFFGMLPTP